MHVGDEDLLVAPVAGVGRGAAHEVELEEVAGRGWERVVLVCATQGIPFGVVGVEQLLQL